MIKDPFAPSPETAPSNLFGGSSDPDDLGEGFDIPPTPVGVLRGHVAEAKRLPSGGIVLDIKCEDPAYAGADNVGLWVGSDMHLLGRIAGALGITVDIRGGKMFFRDSEGVTSLKAFKHKPGLFVYCPYDKEGLPAPSISKYGLPHFKNADADSPSAALWEQYMSEANFSDEQIAAIKQAPGVIPGDKSHLFT